MRTWGVGLFDSLQCGMCSLKIIAYYSISIWKMKIVLVFEMEIIEKAWNIYVYQKSRFLIEIIVSSNYYIFVHRVMH